MDEAAAVFSATATAVRVDEPLLGGGLITATFRTDHLYKGEPETEFEVSTRAQGSACGYTFVKGGRYLVFARSADSGPATTLCSGNLRLPAGEQPLRLSDRTQGTKLTPELIAALGTPTRVDAEQEPPAPDRADLRAIATVVGALVLTATVIWMRTKPLPIRNTRPGAETAPSRPRRASTEPESPRGA
ncbi:hypothetical protein [Nonomuraea sp. NPDC048916]|uniref:hypothetical protein n=1 Tax=Nonomuraea sp. NPDC048916 TaxID=3154232 RepID=UPI0033DBB3E9